MYSVPKGSDSGNAAGEKIVEYERRERIGALAHFIDGAPGAAVQGAYGATLLADSAGGYVLVGVASFAAAAVLTVVCMRLHEREKREKNNETDKEGNAS